MMKHTVDFWKTCSLEEALILGDDMVLPPPSLADLAHLLSMCSKQRNKACAMCLHAHVQSRGLETHKVIGNHLVPMLVSVGRIYDARQVFDLLACKNGFSLNSLIAGYTTCGKPQHAITLFDEMCAYDVVPPNEHVFVSVLKACAKLQDSKKGLEVHSEVARSNVLSRALHIGAALIDMYAKCGLMAKAQQVFDQLKVMDVVCWNVLLAGYVEHGLGNEALKQFEVMKQKGVFPDPNSLVCSLKACSGVSAIDQSQEIHADIERWGLLESDIEVGNTVVDTYAKLGMLAEAKQVLGMLPTRDVVSWTAVISGYADHGLGKEALECLSQMHSEGIAPDPVTFVCTLKACGSACAVEKGEQIHAEIERQGLLERNLFAGRTLVHMYVKCSLVARARQVFERLSFRDLVSWTSLIAGYAEHGPYQEAVNFYERMQLEGVSPDAVAYVCCLKACGCAGLSEKGQEIHCEVERRGLFEHNLVLGNALVDMYAKCGMLNIAHEVFSYLHTQDVVSWNALITGCAEHCYSEKALEHFDQMQLEHICPNAATFIWSLKACGNMGDMDTCRKIHAEIDRRGMLETELALGSTLVDIYAKGGLLSQAQEVFESLPTQDVLTWNALIAGYTEHEQGELALKCCEQMQCAGVSPNAATYVCSLNACASMGASEKGFEIHKQIERQGLLETNLLLGNSLTDMYLKCGLLSKARDVFSKLPVRDVISWTCLMTGYAQFGESRSVFRIFDRMLGEGVEPNFVTFLVVLGACSRMGLYHKSQTYFNAMSKDYGIDPNLEHQNCLIDSWSRVGHLDKVDTVIKEMPFCPNLVVWRSVLGACTRWGNVEFAKQAFKCAVGLDEKNAVAYNCVPHIGACTDLEGEVERSVGVRAACF